MFRNFLFGGLALIGSLAAVSPSDASNNLGHPGRPGYPGLRNPSFPGNQFRTFGFVVQFRQMQLRAARFFDRGEAFRFAELQRRRGFETDLCQERGLWVVH